jgi:hypothetical protein
MPSLNVSPLDTVNDQDDLILLFQMERYSACESQRTKTSEPESQSPRFAAAFCFANSS